MKINPDLKSLLRPVCELHPDPDNVRRHNQRNLDAIRASLSKFGQVKPIVALADGTVIAGNGTLEAATQLGATQLAVVTFADRDQAQAFAIADNRTAELADWNPEELAQQLADLGDLESLGFTDDELEALTADPEPARGPGPTLADRFLCNPFSVFDVQAEWWQDRKRWWSSMGLGIRQTDPVLCELLLRWFCPKGGHVLDPFAGDAVRGATAVQLGMDYTGMELSETKVKANRDQWADMAGPEARAPAWVHGDSAHLGKLLPPRMLHDMVLTCAPHHGRGGEGSDIRDLGGMDWDEYRTAYQKVIRSTVARLKPHCFAAIVVGDIRGDDGLLRGMVPETLYAFELAGCRLYNEAVTVNPVGTLGIHCSTQFDGSRRLGQRHSTVLVFVKGDWGAAVKACGPVTVEVPDATE